MESHELRGRLHRLVPDRRVKQCDLVADRARNHMKGLFHIAELLSFLLVREPICRLALDQSLTGIRAIESQKQLKDRTLSGAGTPRQRYLLARVNCET